ncbi:MAG TPA: 2OG-Fe(II) oxygenase, partial [Tepidisphaeraceae bacterium]|nr:2OG-Fe(II) oxygenase [Tepidisphaeraceae bacterium]
LNDDYEGGYLRFPEYGPNLYRPTGGGACVFGCSLLHEATDVTAGRRFVLLTFLYGEKEAKLREEYAKRTGGGYRAG